MDLFIETLTGTAFELRVSPFETIMSVKAKIQRLEGKLKRKLSYYSAWEQKRFGEKEFLTHRCPSVCRSYLLVCKNIPFTWTCFRRFALTSTINNLKCVVLLLL